MVGVLIIASLTGGLVDTETGIDPRKVGQISSSGIFVELLPH